MLDVGSFHSDNLVEEVAPTLPMLGIAAIGKGNKDTLISSMDVHPPPGGTRSLTVAYVDIHWCEIRCWMWVDSTVII